MAIMGRGSSRLRFLSELVKSWMHVRAGVTLHTYSLKEISSMQGPGVARPSFLEHAFLELESLKEQAPVYFRQKGLSRFNWQSSLPFSSLSSPGFMMENKAKLLASVGTPWDCNFSTLSAQDRRAKQQKKREVMNKIKNIRKQHKLKKERMSEEEKMLWRLRKTNRKIAILHQKLKKYELPEDPESQHDPEIITTEQLQALKKIGYKNKNYVPVGRRGIYGGTIQNMHMHWKKHETVQVDCHIFPKERIKSMAHELARLSGGIVIDIHQATTVILYRGKNYRQPKMLIPPNLLDKRKALFKSKYEQALASLEEHAKNVEKELANLRRQNSKIERKQLTVSEESIANSPEKSGLGWIESEDNEEGYHQEGRDSLHEDEDEDEEEYEIYEPSEEDSDMQSDFSDVSELDEDKF